MTERLNATGPAAVVIPAERWREPVTNYICRAKVTKDGSGYCARAIRVPEVVARGQSEDEAFQLLLVAYKRVLEERTSVVTFRPIAEIDGRDLLNAIQGKVKATIPSVRDIDAAYEDTELSEEEADALSAQRSAGSARHTIPLVRYQRQ